MFTLRVKQAVVSSAENPISAEKALVQPRISMENGGAIRKAPCFLVRMAAR